MGAIETPRGRRLCRRAGLRLQYRAIAKDGQRRTQMLGRPDGPAVSRRGAGCRPQLLRYGLHAARDSRTAMGEDKGFDYLKRLHRNVNQYTKSGAAPAKATRERLTQVKQ